MPWGPWNPSGRGAGHLKCAFVVRSFDVGGSERQLLHLTRGLVERDHDVLVVVIEAGGTLTPELVDTGARVVEVTDDGIGWLPLRIGPLLGPIRQFRPDVLHGYLAFANTLAVHAGPFLPGTRVVQGIRGIQPERDAGQPMVRAFYRAEAMSSRFADAIISNSESGRTHALARGFPESRIHVVPNGIDINALHPDPDAGKQLRSEWSVADDEILVGRVAHFRPTKDYGTFLRAAAVAARGHPELRFVVVGDGPARGVLRAIARGLGLDGRVIWTGERRDMATIMNALDIMVSSSRWESFPNVVGEAMACGVPCAVTDTGDSAVIVGPTGAVAPPAAPHQLGAAVLGLLDRLKRDDDGLRAQARARIAEQFTVENMVTRTERILLDLAGFKRQQSS